MHIVTQYPYIYAKREVEEGRGTSVSENKTKFVFFIQYFEVYVQKKQK